MENLLSNGRCDAMILSGHPRYSTGLYLPGLAKTMFLFVSSVLHHLWPASSKSGCLGYGNSISRRNRCLLNKNDPANCFSVK
jgi:hypothetical protein